MNPREIIRHHGGPTALAEKLGYKKPHGVQRCSNWARRGIPLAVRVSRPDLFPAARPELAEKEAA